jgi:hypothetical protein
VEEAPVAAPAEPVQQQVMVVPAPATGNNQQAELLFWESIKDSNNPAVFDAYLKQFPNGVFAALAQAKLDELKPTQQPKRKCAPPSRRWPRPSKPP